MTGLYTLNTTDMFTAYGFVPKPGASNPLLTPRKRKPIYSNNWAERNANNTANTVARLDTIISKMNNNANNALAAGL